MAVGILGKRIKELRQKKQVTQEELGKAVGVTTQAVSKWECGGVPDAELLPSIADFFEVTIDSLFGRTEEIKQNIGLAIRHELIELADDEKYEKCFNYCWSIILGILGQASTSIIRDIEEMYEDDINQFYSRIITDKGYIFAKLSKDFHYFFLLPEVEEGNKYDLPDEEEYQKLFQTLGKKNMMKLVLYLNQRKNDGFTVKFLCKNLKLEEEEIENMLHELCNIEIVIKQEIETEEGFLVSYCLIDNPSVLPFLLFAKEIIKQPYMMYPIFYDRKKPLLQK